MRSAGHVIDQTLIQQSRDKVFSPALRLNRFNQKDARRQQGAFKSVTNARFSLSGQLIFSELYLVGDFFLYFSSIFLKIRCLFPFNQYVLVQIFADQN